MIYLYHHQWNKRLDIITATCVYVYKVTRREKKKKKKKVEDGINYSGRTTWNSFLVVIKGVWAQCHLFSIRCVAILAPWSISSFIWCARVAGCCCVQHWGRRRKKQRKEEPSISDMNGRRKHVKRESPKFNPLSHSIGRWWPLLAGRHRIV